MLQLRMLDMLSEVRRNPVDLPPIVNSSQDPSRASNSAGGLGGYGPTVDFHRSHSSSSEVLEVCEKALREAGATLDPNPASAAENDAAIAGTTEATEATTATAAATTTITTTATESATSATESATTSPHEVPEATSATGSATSPYDPPGTAEDSLADDQDPLQVDTGDSDTLAGRYTISMSGDGTRLVPLGVLLRNNREDAKALQHKRLTDVLFYGARKIPAPSTRESALALRRLDFGNQNQGNAKSSNRKASPRLRGPQSSRTGRGRGSGFSRRGRGAGRRGNHQEQKAADGYAVLGIEDANYGDSSAEDEVLEVDGTEQEIARARLVSSRGQRSREEKGKSREGIGTSEEQPGHFSGKIGPDVRLPRLT
eukprot:TRINITY_DN6920_c2_g1_i1.p1 TRINITY_DN6920_c2_g1~~TRINITY_DN6920_c2_g1_i1.p1  ORF type:complete len:371 (+),score=82.69 TRINITY_DN6920_c2_g1_i1:90-1202(+)